MVREHQARNLEIPDRRFASSGMTLNCFALLAIATSLSQHHLLDVAQLLLAEEYFVADKECRRAESATLDRTLRVLDQPGLHVGLASAREQPFGVESGGRQRRNCYFRVVHFLGLD